MSRSRTVLVLVGPTASGKTAVGAALAELLRGEVISADSRQVYRYLDIGTAKPSGEILASVPHHFVDEIPPDRDFSAGEFGERGRGVIEELFSRGRIPIVVGGSGLYIQSLVDGFFEGPGADRELRSSLERRLAEEGVDTLFAELERVDPEYAAKVDRTKPRRIIRALEVFVLTGEPISRRQKESRMEIRFAAEMFGLEWDRIDLYRRINARCDEMLRAGLLDEVERLEARGYGPELNALNTVGYAEAFAYRSGRISYDEMVRLFKQNSRRYAKRQMTWFRRDRRIRWIRMDEHRIPGDVASEISQIFQRVSV
jgi:tRNA dimethylallyltransferase